MKDGAAITPATATAHWTMVYCVYIKGGGGGDGEGGGGGRVTSRK